MDSPALKGAIDAHAHVDPVASALRVLNLYTMPAVIVGHSMGVSSAVRVAARHTPTYDFVAFDALLYFHRYESQ